ncbi:MULTISPECIES: cell division protein FtsQ/DivIB [Aerococcus]|uniref:cell division protein FtsQ/DivIB n=1 Tax=Aerococcus TaxID=1375 RepID=UPI0018A746AE|nr:MULTISPECIES: FtsQ-type POTRA domain-containing protein [Aerococcus]MCY3036580.1 FtsQ-type POTRA domain-containing protein [Aerococcus sp. Group 2]MCY3039541.1 FtsQ-type POTRA domain-containing protein [Aerococcus sp. Group 2]MCY3041443.1 FtsQ-type POTRA domain-containing protein [Aerococcus sp. Group 2]MCY3042995.1 FtsQ-type POTRA domain-containing protein [Aerococcus sp. Group 2]MDK6520636.1 FtsQ-type POTRA domain-containing protein [Aerococcus urinae]
MVDWDKEAQRFRQRRQEAEKQEELASSEGQADESSDDPGLSQTHPQKHLGLEDKQQVLPNEEEAKGENFAKDQEQKHKKTFNHRKYINWTYLSRSKNKKVQLKSVSWSRLILAAAFLFMIIFSVFWLSPLNRIAAIEVSGNNIVPQEQILYGSGLRENMTYLGIESKTGVVDNRLKQLFPSVRSVQLNAKGNRTVEVNVQEFRAIGYVKKQDFYYPVLENHIILDGAIPYLDQDIPLFTGFEDQELLHLANQLSKLSDDLLAKINEVVNISDDNYPNHIALKMEDGNIVVGFIDSIADRMQYYDQIVSELEGKTGVINMEVGSYFQEKNPLNDPFVSPEERSSYQEKVDQAKEKSKEKQAKTDKHSSESKPKPRGEQSGASGEGTSSQRQTSSQSNLRPGTNSSQQSSTVTQTRSSNS